MVRKRIFEKAIATILALAIFTGGVSATVMAEPANESTPSTSAPMESEATTVPESTESSEAMATPESTESSEATTTPESTESSEATVTSEDSSASERMSRATDLDIPDETLRKAIWDQVLSQGIKTDSIPDTYLSTISTYAGELNLDGNTVYTKYSGFISNYTGLHYLTSLKKLNLNNYVDNKLFDLSANVGLEILSLNNSQIIGSFDISNNVNLKELTVGGMLGVLDVSNNTKLEKLECSYSSIARLMVGNNTNLTYLDASGNALMFLDLSGAKQLTSGTLVLDNQSTSNLTAGSSPFIPYLWMNADVSEVGFHLGSLGADPACVTNITSSLRADKSDYNPATGEFKTDSGSFGGTKLVFDYHIFGKDNPTVMAVEIDLTVDSPNKTFEVTFRYLDSNMTWKTETVYDVPLGGSAPIPADAVAPAGQKLTGWTLNPNYVISNMTTQAIYDLLPVEYTVKFVDYDGTELSTQTIEQGNSATAPTIPTHSGMEFLKWDVSFDQVFSNLTVKPIYKVSAFSDKTFRDYVWTRILNSRVDPYTPSDTTNHFIYSTDLDALKVATPADFGYDFENIRGLNGIEFLTGLTSLTIYGNNEGNALNNNLSGTLDLSKNINLATIHITNTNLEGVTVGDNDNLRLVYLNDNKLKTLDLSNCNNLGKDSTYNGIGCVVLRDNELTELKLGEQPYMWALDVSGNRKLGNPGLVDVSKAPNLIDLYCSECNLTELNVTKNPELKTLFADVNLLTTMNVSENPKLKQLNVDGRDFDFAQKLGNRIVTLDLSKNTELTHLTVGRNKVLSNLNLENNPNLAYLDCASNNITDLDVSKAPALIKLSAGENKISSINLDENTKLQYLDMSVSPLLTSLSLAKNTELTEISCGNSDKLEVLDLTKQDKLKTLSASGNSLYRLDLSASAPFNGTFSIGKQKPRTLYAESEQNNGALSYIYDMRRIAKEPTDLTKISFDGALDGTYNSTTGKIAFNSQKTEPTVYTYDTGATNGNATNLNVTMNPNFDNFFTVTFMNGEDIFETQEVSDGKKAVSPKSPVIIGSSFSGWYTDTDTQWDFKTNTVTENITLYAKFTPIIYTITVNKDNGEDPDVIGDLRFGDKLTKPQDPVKPGYTFVGWYKEATHQNEWNFATDTIDGATTNIYAKWQAKTYTVKYDSGTTETTFEDKTDVLFTDDALIPQDAPTRIGYTFTGWSFGTTTVSGTDKFGDLVPADDVAEITLTATWRANTYQVHFDTMTPDVTVESKEVNWYDDNLLPTTPKRDGYALSAWTINGTTVSTDMRYCDLTADSTDGTAITLEAQWIELKDYTVTYNTDGGTLENGESAVITGLKYTDIVLLPKTVRSGYTFVSWLYNGQPVAENTAYSTLQPDGDIKTIELTAKWEENVPDPDESGSNSQNPDESGNNSQNPGEGGNVSTDIPALGDSNSGLFFAFLLLLVSGGAAVLLVIRRKGRYTK